LVSYKQKHNDENGEYNRDGTDANYSDNCGVEGLSQNPGVQGMRKRLIKNALLTLFISRGVPMLLGGDEFRRTQRGNNNAYCQDNEVSWFDWSLLEKHKEIQRFTRGTVSYTHLDVYKRQNWGRLCRREEHDHSEDREKDVVRAAGWERLNFDGERCLCPAK